MNDEQAPPQFPSYPNPTPRFADRKQAGPLFKMAKFLMKPKTKSLPKRRLSGKKKHQVHFL